MAVRNGYPGTQSPGDVLTSADIDSMPGGEIAYATKTADQASITSTVDITSLTLTVTMSAERRYRTTIKGEFVHIVADGVAVIQLADGSNNQLDRWVVPGVTTQSQSHQFSYEENGSGGSVTRKVRAAKLSGTSTGTYSGAATWPARITIEDIGPAFT